MAWIHVRIRLHFEWWYWHEFQTMSILVYSRTLCRPTHSAQEPPEVLPGIQSPQSWEKFPQITGNSCQWLRRLIMEIIGILLRRPIKHSSHWRCAYLFKTPHSGKIASVWRGAGRGNSRCTSMSYQATDCTLTPTVIHLWAIYIKLYSAVPHSMADKHTVSDMTYAQLGFAEQVESWTPSKRRLPEQKKCEYHGFQFHFI